MLRIVAQIPARVGPPSRRTVGATDEPALLQPTVLESGAIQEY
jgi:hypothetical protein